MPELSVIMPVYNAGLELERSVKAIQKQTFSDFELILVDDGSTDGSGELCDKYAAADKRIRVLHKENGGSGSARNMGIHAAKGTYIIFPDADDYCKPEMFQTLLEVERRTKADLVICSVENVLLDSTGRYQSKMGQRLFDEEVHSKQETHELWFRIRRLNIGILNSPWNKLYKRTIIEENKIQFPDLRRAQDAVFNLYYYNCICSVCVIDQCLYRYFVNDLIKIGKKFPRDVYICLSEHNRVMEKVIDGWGMYYGEYKTLCDNNLLGDVDYCVALCENPVWNLTRKEKKMYFMQLMQDDYLYGRLKNYSGDVREIEDLIVPFLQYNTGKILYVLKKRRWIEKLRQSKIAPMIRSIRRWVKRKNGD